MVDTNTYSSAQRSTPQTMATDYDAPRTAPEDEPANESLEAIQVQRSATTQTAVIDAEDFDTAYRDKRDSMYQCERVLADRRAV